MFHARGNGMDPLCKSDEVDTQNMTTIRWRLPSGNEQFIFNLWVAGTLDNKVSGLK